MRRIKVLLHRKLDCQAKCLCGSGMYPPTDSPTGEWQCKRQWRNKEPKHIFLSKVQIQKLKC